MPEVSPQPSLENQPAQPQLQGGKGISWKKIVVSIAVIVVIAGIIVGGLYWFFVLNEEEMTTTETTKVSTPSAKQATPSAKKDETADWTEFKSELSPYSIKYPPEWQYQGPGSGPTADHFLPKNSVGRMDLRITRELVQNDEDSDYQVWRQGALDIVTKSVEDKITVGGKEWSIIKGDDNQESKKYYREFLLYIEGENKWVIEWVDNSKKDNTEVFHKILSTFKVLD